MSPAAKKPKASTSSRKASASKIGASKAKKPAKAAKKKAARKKPTAAKAAAVKSTGKKAAAAKPAPSKAIKASKKPTPTKAAPKGAPKASRKTAAKSPAAKPPVKTPVNTPPVAEVPVQAVAKPAAKPAPAPPKPKRKRAPKTILAEARENLDRIYGPITLPETADILEKAVYLVLREGGTELTTAKALKALKAEFVDWNEVRVSRSSELARLMSGTSKVAGIRRFHERSTRLREMIDQIYGDRNETSLEFILEEKPKGQLEYLEDFDDLGLHNAYALVQWLSEKETLVLVSSEMAEAAHTLGILESAAVSKAKKALNDMCKNHVDRVTLVAHLHRLGELEYKEWPTAMKEMMN